jgi:hypothetical protein
MHGVMSISGSGDCAGAMSGGGAEVALTVATWCSARRDRGMIRDGGRCAGNAHRLAGCVVMGCLSGVVAWLAQRWRCGVRCGLGRVRDDDGGPVVFMSCGGLCACAPLGSLTRTSRRLRLAASLGTG